MQIQPPPASGIPRSGGSRDPVRDPARDPARRVLPAQPVRAAVVIGSFTALLYLIELINAAMSGRLDHFGIVPRTVSGLDGVIWAPLLHASWTHLFSNTIPVLVLGFLAIAGGLRQWVAVTAVIWVVSGLGVWLAGGPGYTVGASGVAFGWLAFLLLRGIFNRGLGQILVALVLLFCWGGMLWGLLPGQPQVSWQAHVFGALGGVFAAWLVAVSTRRAAGRRQQPPGGPSMGPLEPPMA
ncbi:MAG TPA: rhomboid family intramembrane serine protease [Pseudonocardiaceae bacterium]|jgi:membrane associated rhomboid family serine protease|nr:rhomboid family intramembrane serine protease [Pseudonocardiaceae bacterium]